MGPDFFEKKAPEVEKEEKTQPTQGTEPPVPDIEMAETKSHDSYDPIFDEDADGEVVVSNEASAVPTPTTESRPALSLALPVPKTPSNSLFAPLTSASSTKQELASTIPTLTPTTYQSFSNDVLLTSSMDGQVTLIDKRLPKSAIAGRLVASEKAPPWCMSVSSVLFDLF